MKYFIKCDDQYFTQKNGKGSFLTKSVDLAFCTSEIEKANNRLASLPKIIRDMDWKIVTTENAGEAIYHKVDVNDVLCQLDDLAEKIRLMKSNKEHLLEQQSQVDLKISDAIHYLENYPISASDGYKISKIIQDATRERRKIKDELIIIDMLDSGCGQVVNKSVQNRIKQLDKRQYKPRVMKALFENKRATI